MELNVTNLVKWFQLKYPKLVRAMSKSSHHFKDGEILNPYHLEGSVFTHNMMVMLEAARLKNKLDGNEYIHVIVSALLHDIGKPLARKVNEEKQRVHFWGHEPMSAFLSIPILDDIEQDFKVKLNKRLIIETIAMHTDVYNVPREKLAAILTGNKGLANMLSYLSECDYAGRFFDMGERDMEMIKPNNKIGTMPIRQHEVVCMIGLPCSGKSTIVDNMMLKGQQILSRDDIVMEVAREQGIASYNEAFKSIDQKEVDKRFQKRKNELQKHEGTVWIDMTNMSRKSRRKTLNGFKNHKKTAYVVMTSLDNIYLRNKNRNGKVIPDSVFERMITSFQPPLYDEFDEIYWEFN